MPPPSSHRYGSRWYSWCWPAGWSWPERLLAALVCLLPALTLILGGAHQAWLAGGLVLLALGVLHGILRRHGGWQLLGPHFYYDVVRLARRGQSTRLRVAYLIALFIALLLIVQSTPTGQAMRPNDFARVSERFAFVLFLVQNIAVLVLTPAYLASSIAEEKERRTLELLFTTQLSDTEIILGILCARIIHLAGFILAGFPILCVIQFWGGIDMLLLTGNLVNSLLNILTIGSICMLASTLAQTASGAMLVSYLLILPIGFGCMGFTPDALFVLQDARTTSSSYYTVQNLPLILIGHVLTSALFLGMAVMNLRVPPMEPSTMSPPLPPAHQPRPAPEVLLASPGPPRKVRAPERLDFLSTPYTKPPVWNHSLLWKECFLDGPVMAFSPHRWMKVVPFLLNGALCMGFVIMISMWDGGKSLERTLDTWFPILRFFYYFILGWYGLGVAFRATSSVTRERQQQTLEPLLLLPVDRREILGAKWLGSLWWGWPLMALLYGNAALGVILGAYHPFSAVLLCLAPWPMLFFFTSLGLLLSVTIQTVLRANLVMLLVVILFLSSIAASSRGMGTLAYLETFAFSFWQLPQETHRESLVFASLIMAGYLSGAWICWRAALYLFERRTHPTGE